MHRITLPLSYVICVGTFACISVLTTNVNASLISTPTISIVNNSEDGPGDPLANFVTQDLKIDFSGIYTGSQLRLNLTSGSIFQEMSFGSQVPPLPGVLGLAPHVAWDTFVAQGAPTLDSPSARPSLSGGAINLGGAPTAVFTDAEINQGWFVSPGLTLINLADFMVARVTLSNDAAGEFSYLGSVDSEQETFAGTIRNGQMSFDGDSPDVGIDELTDAIKDGDSSFRFDLNDDGFVDELDRIHWIEVDQNSYVGDSNLDGEFTTADLVVVFSFAEYEDGIDHNSRWESGDWDGDCEFNSSDLIAAFAAGGYEQGTRQAQQVPEPTFTSLVTLVVLVPFFQGRVRRKSPS